MKVGIVGAGNQSLDSLIPAIRSLQDVSLVAIADLDSKRAREVAEQLSIPHSFHTAEAMIGSLEIDALIAACPPQSHVEIATLALDRGLAIFVEKPPATSTVELQGLSNLSDGITNGVGMNFRYATAVRHLTSLLNSGHYGLPVQVTIRHLANKPREPLWGLSLLQSLLLAQVIHPIDFTVSILAPIDHITAVTRSRNGSLTLGVHLVSETGQMATIVSGTASNRFTFGVDVVTDEGVTVSCDDLWMLTVSGSSEDNVLGLPWMRQWSAGALDRGYSRAGYQGELREFLDCVQHGRAYTPSLTDLLPTYRIMDAIIEAARE